MKKLPTERIFAIGMMLVLISSCQSLQFYQQAIVGQTKLMSNRQSVDTLLVAEDTDPALRYRLEITREILDFAISAGFPDNGSYSTYVETGQKYIIWNVFAAKPYELALRESCFPVAGCVSYRGYFGKQDAEQYAAELKADGFEVYLGGVSAYSTLGWFKDPLLDTFLFRSEEQLAALLFHELAHGLIYIKDDTRFNESVATAVELFLLEAFLQARGEQHRFDQVRKSRERRQRVITLIEEARQELQSVYAADTTTQEMEPEKQRIFADLVLRYQQLAAQWGDEAEFKHWMAGDLNNAKLETVADYHYWVPAFTAILNDQGVDGFKTELSRLAALREDQRVMELAKLTKAYSKPG